ncbi:hypothetical protein GQ43DRAFT_469040 [Delitschia confertaspora ATCC 74209]|uniref:Uncharacterized protein n=1 Tax=Delitschia confertaspora ATCC 74209 TaxID=1513339 RepID=A0A9P4JSD5_9PLEO|nr:hypothetical protein GQ43DRAFT_469040 [Delitschia confertaspora ATCC 74209]
MQLSWFAQAKSVLGTSKTDTLPTHSLEKYMSDLANKVHNFIIVVTPQGTGLRLFAQDKPLTTYKLKKSFDGDTFYWPMNLPPGQF